MKVFKVIHPHLCGKADTSLKYPFCIGCPHAHLSSVDRRLPVLFSFIQWGAQGWVMSTGWDPLWDYAAVTVFPSCPVFIATFCPRIWHGLQCIWNPRAGECLCHWRLRKQGNRTQQQRVMVEGRYECNWLVSLLPGTISQLVSREAWSDGSCKFIRG